MSESKNKSIPTLIVGIALGVAGTLGLTWIKKKIFPDNTHKSAKRSQKIKDRYNELIELYNEQPVHSLMLKNFQKIYTFAASKLTLNKSEINAVLAQRHKARDPEELSPEIQAKITALEKLNRLGLLNLRNMIRRFDLFSEEFERLPEMERLPDRLGSRLSFFARVDRSYQHERTLFYKCVFDILLEVEPNILNDEKNLQKLIEPYFIKPTLAKCMTQNYVRLEEHKQRILTEIAREIEGTMLGAARRADKGIYTRVLPHYEPPLRVDRRDDALALPRGDGALVDPVRDGGGGALALPRGDGAIVDPVRDGGGGARVAGHRRRSADIGGYPADLDSDEERGRGGFRRRVRGRRGHDREEPDRGGHGR